MCGRYSQTRIEERELKERFKLKKIPQGLQKRFNIAPQQNVPVILNATPEEISLVRWGLVPGWAEGPNMKYTMINARAESLREKPMYRGLVRRKRCLIIADSFYEWKKEGKTKQPFRIMLENEGLFCFAGLWDHWERDGNEITSCTIITTDANRLVRPIHDRMPVILPREREGDWLAEIRDQDLDELLKPYDPQALKAYPVSPAVNNPKNDQSDIILPLSPH